MYQKSVKFKKKDNKSFLISGKNEVLIPGQYCELTEYILSKNL